MYEVVNDFLRGTKRIVSVVLYATVLVHLSKQEMMWMRHKFREITNSDHRFDQSKNWAMFRDYKACGLEGNAAEVGPHVLARMATGG